MLVNSSTPRNNFNITTFAQAVDLGDPIAGNFFLVGPMDDTSTSTQAASTTGSQPTPTAPVAGSLTPTNSLTLPPLSAAPTAAPTTSTTSRGLRNIMRIYTPQAVLIMAATLLAQL